VEVGDGEGVALGGFTEDYGSWRKDHDSLPCAI
jgi:hypothetical protein